MIKDRIRELALANGFTIKEGLDDLKPYVYEFAGALLTDDLGEAKQTTAERATFYAEQMRNPNTHAALAFELAFLRAKLDKHIEATQDGAMLDWIGSFVVDRQNVEVGFVNGTDYSVRVSSEKDGTATTATAPTLREALLEAMRHADE